MSIRLNVARIVHRLLLEPRGWRVDQLRRELRIAERTYRKYRQLLRDEFLPFMSGELGRVAEVEEADGRYLRLVGGRRRGRAGVSAEPELPPCPCQLGGRDPRRVAGELLPSEVHAELEQDPEAGRLFLAFCEGARHGERRATLRNLALALVRRRRVVVRSACAQGRRESVLEPLTLARRDGALRLIARRPGEWRPFGIRVADLVQVDVLPDGFVYPLPAEFDPAEILRRERTLEGWLADPRLGTPTPAAPGPLEPEPVEPVEPARQVGGERRRASRRAADGATEPARRARRRR